MCPLIPRLTQQTYIHTLGKQHRLSSFMHNRHLPSLKETRGTPYMFYRYLSALLALYLSACHALLDVNVQTARFPAHRSENILAYITGEYHSVAITYTKRCLCEVPLSHLANCASSQQQTVTALGMRFCSLDQSYGPPRVSSHLVGIYPHAIPCLPHSLLLLGSPLVPKGVWSPRRSHPSGRIGENCAGVNRVQATQANQQAHRTCNKQQSTNNTTVKQSIKAAVCPRILHT
ncbi:hypothetical protein HD806DRAFT_486098 [Xylariaceae sp. AK1471]|nr:hypothetical protein HD806DRAFT_486098 [Xylariaceae sp. AK1471]